MLQAFRCPLIPVVRSGGTVLSMDHKILLIDDSAILRRIATNVLSTRAGCGEVVTATRATEGFARACTLGAGLILVDYQIAGFPRADLCQRLLDEPRTSRVPVVLLLGPGMTLPAPETLPANVVDHLVKPFTPEQLLSTVRSVFKAAPMEAPIRHLPPAVRAPETMADHHEVAVALSTAAVARRETSRFSGVHRHPPRSPAPVRGQGLESRPAEPIHIHDALVAAANRGETAVLRVHDRDGGSTEVYLDGGRIVVVATRDAARYGEDADGVVPPKVSSATLEDAIASQTESGTPFFLSLGSCGLLSKSAALTLLHRFGQRHFARLWAKPTGTLTFEYETLDALPGFALRLEPRPEPVEAWLFEASRYLQSADIAALMRHEGLGGVPRLHGASILEALPLDDQEREFIRWMDGRRNLATVAAGVTITPEHAFLLLYRFRCLGLMDYRPAGSAFVVTPRTSVRRVLPLQR